MPRLRPAVVIAWGICIIVIANSFFDLASILNSSGTNRQLAITARGLELLISVFFAIPGALIISRHPRNIIGWLLLGPTLVFIASSWMSRYLDQFQTAPPPTLPNLLMTWVVGASWVALIFPLFLIPLLFPTGRPPTPRWRWPVYLAAAMCLIFAVWSGGSKIFMYESDVTSWEITNPIGFLPLAVDQFFTPIWTVLLGVLTVSSLASTGVRYRRASAVEREQLKWLLFGCAIFAVVYLLAILFQGDELRRTPGLRDLFSVLFFIGMSTIPAAIAIAILRYRLFDINVIIRLTLVYAVVTGMLGLVYAGGVVLLQPAFRALTGQGSDLAVVITTLIIAALFTPLRLRIQAVIDRRFFRQKYNAEQALAEFALASRRGADLDALTVMMVDIVQKTLQPTQVGLQLYQRERQKESRGE